MSAVSTPTPITRASSRTIACGRSEAPDAEAGQATPHPVDDAGALADQALALPVRAPGVLLREGRDRGHAAVAPLAAQPTQEGTLEQPGVEPVGLGAPVLAGDGDARRVDDVGLDLARPQPARQPEAVPAGLEGDREAGGGASRLGRLVPPAMQEAEQGVLVRLELLQRVAIEARHDAGDEPARAAQLDDGDQRAVLLEGDEGPAQVVALRHGAPHRLSPAAMVLRLRRPPHSLFNRRTAKLDRPR